MHDHYVACVVIIFVALLATIPTYREMMRPQTMINDGSVVEIIASVAPDGPGIPAGPAIGTRDAVAPPTVRSAGGFSLHPHTATSQRTIPPGWLGWTLIDGSVEGT